VFREHKESIRRDWIDKVRADPGGHYRERSAEELAQWITQTMDALSEAIATGSSSPVIVHARRIGQERWKLGFDIGEVARALLSLKGVVLPRIVEASSGDPESIVRSVAEFDEFLDSGVAEFSRLYAENMRRSLDVVHENQERMLVLEERQKLARDLHDSVAQSIYGVSLHAEAALRILPPDQDPKARGYLRQIRESALDALREMRLLIFELRPSAIRERGLVGVLQERLRAVEDRAGFETRLECESIARFAPSVEEGLYGIAREAMNNCLKHANASTVVVRLRSDGPGLTMEIEDDGVGFDTTDAHTRGGLGLQGMRDRARKLGGELVVRSEPGRGTCVTVRLPADTAAHPTEGALHGP
jgi:signal transduction histidine kinase